MTAKNKAKTSSKQDSHILRITKEKGKSEIRQLTESQLSPVIANTEIVKSFACEIDMTEAVAIMRENSVKIIAGDLSELESTLSAQVVSLNAIFNTLARRSASNEYLKQMEVNMRLALKAQAQCARTVEVLATLKNPPIVFAKQANIAQGHQQINNNQSPTHAGKTINSSNELLNEANHATLDTRGTNETSSINQELAAVEAIDRR